jgi:hypothetical protein
MLIGAVAWMGLGLSLPAAGATISLTVSGGGIDSDVTRTCTAVSCSNASTIWSLGSGEEYAATGTITIDTTLNTMTIALAVATSVLDASGAQAAIDGGASSLVFSGGLYTGTVGITNVGGTWQINGGATASATFTLVQAVGAGAGAPKVYAALSLSGSCLLDASNTGQCGLRFGATGTPNFQVAGAGFGAYNRFVRQQFNVDVVPEPGTLMLLGLGLAGLAIRSRRA